MNKYLVLWLNHNNNKYYYRILKHNFNSYCVGYVNEYNHEVILIDDISKYLIVTKHYSFKKRFIRTLISFLQKYL